MFNLQCGADRAVKNLTYIEYDCVSFCGNANTTGIILFVKTKKTLVKTCNYFINNLNSMWLGVPFSLVEVL